MQDLESGLHLIIRSDISHSRIITGHKFDALKEWLRILVKVISLLFFDLMKH